MSTIADELKVADLEADLPLPGEAVSTTAEPAFAMPSDEDYARVMLPALRRASACLNLAIAVAQDPLLGDFGTVLHHFDIYVADANAACRELYASHLPTAGSA